MSLLKTTNDNILREDGAGGAVGAGAVSAFAMPLFTSIVQRTTPPAPKVIKYSKQKKQKKNNLGVLEAFLQLTENDPTTTPSKFDTTEVIAKLKSLENKEKTDARDTTTFGIEDDKGGLVRVTIKNDQAADFEKALQAYMTDVEKDEELPEVAEMLFDLKDRFDIVDVVWPDVAEDEEQEQGIEGQPAAQGAEGGADLGAGLGAEGGADLGAEGGLELGGEDTGQVKDLLTQVIDMMKADADARKAEARAKEAEFKAKEGETMTKQAHSKVKQEEQMLDMDSYYKSKKEEGKEAKRLAQLARWKHEMGGEESDEGMPQQSMGGEEEEIDHNDVNTQVRPERRSPVNVATAANTSRDITYSKPAKQPAPAIRGRVHPHDIAQYILNRVK